MENSLFPILYSGITAGFCILALRLLHIRRIHRRVSREFQDKLDISEEIATTRGNALDYIVRSRVVDYEYDYYGYEINLGDSGIIQIRRIMIFSPPKNKDIICKLITLCEHGLSARPTNLKECGFTAAVYTPDRDPLEYTIEDPRDDDPRILGWDFESHPWLVEVTDEDGKRVKVIVVFIPMITDTRKLEVNYYWRDFYPEFARGETSAYASLSLIKPARVLEIKIRRELPSSMQITLQPPDGRAPFTVHEEGTDIAVQLENAQRGFYSYVLDIAPPIR